MATLRELIDSEPANAGRTDAEVLAWLLEPVTLYVDIEWIDLVLWPHANGLTRAVMQSAATSGTTANQTAAQHLLDCINAGQPLAASRADIRALIIASSLPTSAKNALAALATSSAERWRTGGIAGISEMTLGKVEAARL